MMYETQMQPDGTFWCIVAILLILGIATVAAQLGRRDRDGG
jgi:hypothetical protein